MSDLTYGTVLYSDIESLSVDYKAILFGLAAETDITTLRKSIEGQGPIECVLKCVPENLDELKERAAELGIVYTEYDYAAMLSEMLTDKWKGND